MSASNEDDFSEYCKMLGCEYGLPWYRSNTECNSCRAWKSEKGLYYHFICECDSQRMMYICESCYKNERRVCSKCLMESKSRNKSISKSEMVRVIERMGLFAIFRHRDSKMKLVIDDIEFEFYRESSVKMSDWLLGMSNESLFALIVYTYSL